MALSLPSPGFRAAYRAGRAAATPRKPRTPLLVHAARAVAGLVNAGVRVRSTVLTIAGFGTLDYAAFRFDEIAGLAAVGLSLLVVEWLISSDGDA